MAEKHSSFPAFLAAMRGKRLLHIGHKHADCDALGNAYAMSRVSFVLAKALSSTVE